MLGKVVSAERVKLAIVSGVVQRVLVVGLRRQGPLADAKDFAAADALRDELQSLGYVVETSKDGTRIRRG